MLAIDAKVMFRLNLGLPPLLFLAIDAKVMSISNPEAGLCNSATGTVKDFIYQTDHQPPDLPIAVIVKFDNYIGRSISETA